MSERFRIWWEEAPHWLKQAHHTDPLVHSSLLRCLDQGLDDKETLLALVRVLLDRDAQRLKTIQELQFPVRSLATNGYSEARR